MLSTTITVFACLKYFLEISIAVSTLSLPLVLSVVLFEESSVVLPGFRVGVVPPGVFPPGVGFCFWVTVWSGVKVFVDLSGYVKVTDPSSPTVTSSAFGFTFLTASTTFSFSLSVNFVLSLTSVVAGATAGFFSASVLAFSVTVLSPGISFVEPSL